MKGADKPGIEGTKVNLAKEIRLKMNKTREPKCGGVSKL